MISISAGLHRIGRCAGVGRTHVYVCRGAGGGHTSACGLIGKSVNTSSSAGSLSSMSLTDVMSAAGISANDANRSTVHSAPKRADTNVTPLQCLSVAPSLGFGYGEYVGGPMSPAGRSPTEL